VPLLWINLIQDTLAALALATDPPTPSLLLRKPEPKNSSIISINMWKMIIGQSILQVLVTLILNFLILRIFTSWSEAELKTVVFNTFAWLQITNQVNCRRIDDKLNVFSGIWRNWLFVAIISLTIVAQVLIINFGGAAFSVTRLNGAQWGVSLILGLLSLPLGLLIRLIPNRWIFSIITARLLPYREHLVDPVDKRGAAVEAFGTTSGEIRALLEKLRELSQEGVNRSR
jgi:P-type Ca2+ transporter type 2C